MSWHYSRAPEGESSAGCYAVRLASALLNSPNILAKFSSNDNGTGSYLNFQSGTMSQPSESTTKNAESISKSCNQSPTALSYLADSHVKTFQQQVEGLGLKENGRDSGASSQGSSAKYDPQELKWKTRQRSLFGGLTEFSETWPRWGILQGGEFWGLSMSAHHTRERIWIVATLPDSDIVAGGLLRGKERKSKAFGICEKDNLANSEFQRLERQRDISRKTEVSKPGNDGCEVPDTDSKRLSGSGWAPVSECDPEKGKGKTNITLSNDWWEIEPELGRMADGVANRVDRLKAIGNGQVPAVAAAAWNFLLTGEWNDH